jgi:cytochrome c553
MKKLIFAAIACFAFFSGGSAFALDGNAEAAKAKVSMCQGCHGIPMYKASFPKVYSVPMIGGQQAAYIVKALGEYKSGDRNHPTMRAIAQGLSEQDIADVAAYYSTAK